MMWLFFFRQLLTLFISCVARIGGSPSTSAELALRQATRMYKDGKKQVSGAHHECVYKSVRHRAGLFLVREAMRRRKGIDLNCVMHRARHYKYPRV